MGDAEHRPKWPKQHVDRKSAACGSQVLACVLDGRIPAALPGLWGALQAASPSCFHPISPKAYTSAHLSLLLMRRASTQVRSLDLWCLAAALCIWHVEPFSVRRGMPF